MPHSHPPPPALYLTSYYLNIEGKESACGRVKTDVSYRHTSGEAVTETCYRDRVCCNAVAAEQYSPQLLAVLPRNSLVLGFHINSLHSPFSPSFAIFSYKFGPPLTARKCAPAAKRRAVRQLEGARGRETDGEREGGRESELLYHCWTNRGN